MINKYLLQLSLLTVTLVVFVQPAMSQTNHVDLLAQYRESKPDTARVRLLLKLSKIYLLKPNELSVDLDSALRLAEEAKSLSRDLKFRRGQERADYMIGWIHVEAKHYSALASHMKILSDTNRIKVTLKIAEYKWGLQGGIKAVRDSAKYYSGKALEDARALNSVTLEIQARSDLAEHTGEKLEFEDLKPLLIEGFKSCENAGLPEELSEILLLALLTFGDNDQHFAEIKSIWTATLTDSKSAVETKCMRDAAQDVLEESSRINFYTAKAYTFENSDKYYFRLIELLGETAEQSPLVYASLCYVYFIRGDLTQCVYYGLKAEKLAEKDNARSLPHLTYNFMGQAYYRMGNNDECINYMQKAFALQRSRHITPDGGVIKYLTRAYLAKNRQQDALALLDECTETGEYVNEDLKDLLESKGIVYQSLGQFDKAEEYFLEGLELAKKMAPDQSLVTYMALCRLYLQSKQYTKAWPWLDSLGTPRSKSMEPLYIQEEVALMRFRVDSARGNYKNAIAHLQENRLLHDSIFTEAKNHQLEGLKIQYETDKKNNDILIKTAELRRTTLLRNIFITGAILLFILLAAIYRRYLKNQKTNRLLLTQQQQLQKLNEQQTKLLQEKDWLVKEIHHRVKNNLQIVMSLLNSQSAYIDNEPARTAINHSQHRVHAMSLIHQKLYNTESVSSIDISTYIRELVSYLADSFNTGARIRFEFAVDPLQMDVSEAVPLGLIVNEAITNAMKYAFPENQRGVVSISLSSTSPDHYLLVISDNGIGIPTDLISRRNGSLGMSLMEGLSEDLDGRLSIENNNGTTIKVSFVHDPGIRRLGPLTEALTSPHLV